MPIQVSSNLIPKSGAKWPVVEDVYIKGGLRVVADAAARDSIYLDATAKLGLKNGMLLVTASDNKLWQYQGLGVWTAFKSSATYTFQKATPAAEWDIVHNLNSTFFTYTVFDADGYQILPSECHIVDVNNLVVYFSAPIAGHATFVFDV
jgi:hypothetical protein